MKQSTISAAKVIAATWLTYVALIAVSYFLLVPILQAKAQNGDPVSTHSTVLIVLVAGFFAGAGATFVALAFHYRNRGVVKSMEQDMLDGLSYPLILIDHVGRYFGFNREAEIILDLDRGRDIGSPADSRILLAKNSYPNRIDFRTNKLDDSDDLFRIIELKGKRYRIANSQTGFFGMSQPGTLVTLMDATREMAVKDTLPGINKAMALLESNALKIQDSSTSLSQGATEQASSLASITSFLGEINKKSQGSSDAASQGTQLAVQAREAAERSGNEISNTLKAMEDVQDAGVRIARIVKIIDDVAFQTNLLALNAAVEAARAGRQGKGFAVVADEVRNLAGRSAKAAKDTASMVEDITERIGNACSFIYKLKDMLHDIVQDAIHMADTTASASSASAEQANGILQVNHELSQMDAVTHNTMIAAEQTATAVGVLTRQASELRMMVEGITPDYLSQTPRHQESASPFSALANDYAAPGVSPFPPQSYTRFDDDKSLPEPAPDSFGGADADSLSDQAKKDWDIASELESPSILPELLRSDGVFAERRKATKETGDYRRKNDTDRKFPDATTGDAVVRPTKKIILDDSEFGRY